MTPLRVAGWLVLAFVVGLFLLTNFQNFSAGYSGRAEVIPASRRRFIEDCVQRDHIGETVPDACAYWLDRINKTPFWRGIDNVRDNLNVCLFWSCTDLLQKLISSFGFSVLAYIAAATLALPCAMYVRAWLAWLPQPPASARGMRRQHWIEDGVNGGGDGSEGIAVLEDKPAYQRAGWVTKDTPRIEE